MKVFSTLAAALVLVVVLDVSRTTTRTMTTERTTPFCEHEMACYIEQAIYR